jgi:hypothetical protein
LFCNAEAIDLVFMNRQATRGVLTINRLKVVATRGDEDVGLEGIEVLRPPGDSTVSDT